MDSKRFANSVLVMLQLAPTIKKPRRDLPEVLQPKPEGYGLAPIEQRSPPKQRKGKLSKKKRKAANLRRQRARA